MNRQIRLKPLAASILSLSLLTVMAGAPVKLPYYLAAAVSAVYFIFSLFTKPAGQV